MDQDVAQQMLDRLAEIASLLEDVIIKLDDLDSTVRVWSPGEVDLSSIEADVGAIAKHLRGK